MQITDVQKIGVGLAGFGVAFLFLGVCLLFDKGLLAIGNVSGVGIKGDNLNIFFSFLRFFSSLALPA